MGFPSSEALAALDAYVSCTKVLGLHKDSGTQSTLLQEIGVQHSWTSGKSPRIDIDIDIERERYIYIYIDTNIQGIYIYIHIYIYTRNIYIYIVCMYVYIYIYIYILYHYKPWFLQIVFLWLLDVRFPSNLFLSSQLWWVRAAAGKSRDSSRNPASVWCFARFPQNISSWSQ